MIGARDYLIFQNGIRVFNIVFVTQVLRSQEIKFLLLREPWVIHVAFYRGLRSYRISGGEVCDSILYLVKDARSSTDTCNYRGYPWSF